MVPSLRAARSDYRQAKHRAGNGLQPPRNGAPPAPHGQLSEDASRNGGVKLKIEKEIQMVRNPHILQRFEDEDSRTSPMDFKRSLALLNAMYRHARTIGVWDRGPTIQPFKLRLAKALNV